MSDQVLNIIFNTLGILAVVIIIAIIWFVIWTALRVPIQIKDKIIKEREEEEKELLKIQAAKAFEWDKYKELEEDREKNRIAYFKEKDTSDKLKDSIAKLQVEKEGLLKQLQALKNPPKEKSK